MPRKVFTAGSVLTASDVNTYLMNQTVMTYASSAARGSAAGTVTEGMITWLQDVDQFQYYSGGSVWSNFPGLGTNATVTTNYTATAANAGGFIYSTSSSAITITIPDVFAIGDRVDIIRDGAGTVTIAAGTGVTSWGGAGTAGTALTFKINEQYNAASVIEVAAQTYRVVGKITF